MLHLAAALASIVGLTGVDAPDTTLVRCGHLIAVPGAEPLSEVTVVVKGDRIDAVVPGFTTKVDGAAEVDLRDQWVMPGLIDCHVHITMRFDQTIRPRYATESSELVAIRSTQYARITLESGFTTVRDLGATDTNAVFALRDAIARGIVVGPRILTAGHAIAVTGGHGDSTLGYRPGLFPEQTPADGIADGPEECMKAVRAQIKLGADCIKLTATGGVLSTSSAGLAKHFSDAELKAIVETAHAMGRRVAAHAHGLDGINAAIIAGVDSIEHGTFLDDSSVKLMKEHGTYHVPTLLAAQTVYDNAATPGYYLPMVAAKARLVGPKAKEMFRRSHEAGVKIAFGTDTGVSEHGLNAREFSLMVAEGMSPMEAIRSATIVASQLLGVEKEVGTIEAGKAADLVAVKSSPLADISQLEHVTHVIKGGAVVK
jgi:imidazolonepropionase-like amidohydrolase